MGHAFSFVRTFFLAVDSDDFSSVLYSRISNFTFKPMIHFELALV